MIKLFLFIIFGLLFIACKKDNKDNQDKQGLVLGDISNVVKTTIDSIIIGSKWFSSIYKIDINGDGSPDYSLISEHFNNNTGEDEPICKIFCLNQSSMILGNYKDDTVYMNVDTSILSIDNTNYMHISTKWNCIKQVENDYIFVNKNVFHVFPGIENSNINSNLNFSCDSVNLYKGLYTSGNLYNDTVWYFENNKECDNFPLNQNVYIVTKILNGNSNKLGWIKISIKDEFKLEIKEYAIQK